MIIKSSDRRKTVEHFYQDENVFWHKLVHKYGGSVEQNIQNTLDTISAETIMYEVIEKGELAAFFTVFKHDKGNAVEAFHIGKKYRHEEFIGYFWEQVKSQFDGEICIGLAEQNKPAIEHCERQGFELINKGEIDGKIFVVLRHKNLQPCLDMSIR